MKYSVKGTLKIKFPELSMEGETPEKALYQLITTLIDDNELFDLLDIEELDIKSVRKVFKVVVREVFYNTVIVDTDDYPDVEDESDAENCVTKNWDEFMTDCEYDDSTRDEFDTECDSYETREYLSSEF